MTSAIIAIDALTPKAAPGPVVEVLLISADQDGLRFRVRRADQAGADPDRVALALAGLVGNRADRVLHSTSWRFDASRIVLTYVALPDPQPHAGISRPVPLPDLPARGPDASSPSPGELHIDDVAVHACRHLAFLRATDPNVAAAAQHAAMLWDLISDRFTSALAGALPARRT